MAIVRFQSGGLGSIVTSLSQKPGLYTKVHVHGSNGASVGVETDRGATFVAGVSAIAEPPLNDLWTIPGEEAPARRLPGRGPRPIPADRRHHALPRAADPGLPARPSARTARRWSRARTAATSSRMFTAIYRSHRERRPIPFPLRAE